MSIRNQHLWWSNILYVKSFQHNLLCGISIPPITRNVWSTWRRSTQVSTNIWKPSWKCLARQSPIFSDRNTSLVRIHFRNPRWQWNMSDVLSFFVICHSAYFPLWEKLSDEIYTGPLMGKAFLFFTGFLTPVLRLRKTPTRSCIVVSL